MSVIQRSVSVHVIVRMLDCLADHTLDVTVAVTLTTAIMRSTPMLAVYTRVCVCVCNIYTTILCMLCVYRI